MMAYLVVEVHHAYKIWCPRWAVKEKPGKKENSSNSLRGGDFHQNKTAIFSNGCFRPRIFSPSVRSGTRRVVTDDPLRLFRIPGVRTGEAKGVPGKRFASSFPPGPGDLVLRSVITVSYRADAQRRSPSRCQGLAGGFLFATLATCDRSLPIPLDAISPFGGTLLNVRLDIGMSPRS
jgi:hypothetical protein